MPSTASCCTNIWTDCSAIAIIAMCIPMPTHCTITRFGVRPRWIDGVECCLFSSLAPLRQTNYVWDEYLYSVREKVEVRVTVSVTVCVVLLCCVGWWWWKEGRRWNPVPALLEKHQGGRQELRPHPTDESLSTVLYAFSTYGLRKGLEFNPGLWCTI